MLIICFHTTFSSDFYPSSSLVVPTFVALCSIFIQSLHIFHLMANTTMVTRVFILALIILSTFFMTLQARNLHGHPSIRENNVADNNHRFLHNYLDLLKHIHVDHQDADDAPHKDGNTHRLTPEGPDPHHNFATPPRN
ncbi:hypothetical protein JHK82_034539 [Glycine max]|uniref:Uncharacterized protein n=3 Tax=Glycine subgen. Soja TaxID=1462606 RepID=K7LW57_SOYBN|nr:hypothetical protein JHK86_034610 [Glycine max]KHN27926.1 hypothetical protein glysoja_007658 [Glycine soja]KAG5120119.1 hypothetical protein JHK82_034539 [Glycine max]KAG5141104.1 hypothetical protein JHK84_034872 [Glycine max]KAH1144193.1 hypothetical protein GYH30_034433 [Glycine max]